MIDQIETVIKKYDKEQRQLAYSCLNNMINYLKTGQAGNLTGAFVTDEPASKLQVLYLLLGITEPSSGTKDSLQEYISTEVKNDPRNENLPILERLQKVADDIINLATESGCYLSDNAKQLMRRILTNFNSRDVIKTEIVATKKLIEQTIKKQVKESASKTTKN